MRLYAVVAAGGFRRYATYRVATLAGVFTNTVFGFIMAYTYIALWDERPHLGGYDMSQALTYVWLGQALLMTCAMMGGGFEDELMERIRTGDIAVDLYRPADLQLWWMAGDLGRAAFHLLGRGIVPMVLGALAFDLALPGSPWTWLAFLVSVALGVVVSFAVRFLVALSAFWLMDGAGAMQIAWLAGLFFSGMLLPLNLFPGVLGDVARALPWSSLLQVPADVFLGTYAGWDLAGAYAFQAGWAVVLLLAGRPCSRWRPGGWWSRVAEVRVEGVVGAEPGIAFAERSRLVEGVRAYGLIVAMWLRSTMAYRASFVMTAVGNFVATGFDFVTIMLMFTHVDVLGGYTLPEIALLYGASATAFGLADLVLGSMDRVGRRVRDGTLDTLLVRPVPVLAQVAADRFALRRLGRITQGLLVLGYALVVLDIEWTPLKVAMLPMMVLSGAAVFGAVFVVGAAFQFYAQDASEVQNAFTYGGTTLLQYPPSVFAKDLVRGVTFVVPLAFVSWLPALYVLGRDYPLDLPRWVAFLPPLVAVGCWVVAGLAWRVGLRAYRSTGS